MPSPTPLYQIEECPDLYVDACVCDEQRNLVFLSAWGRDTVTQEFLARLTLDREENGIDHFHIIRTAGAYLSSQTRISWRNAPPASSAARCSAACSTSGCSIGAPRRPTEAITSPSHSCSAMRIHTKGSGRW